MTCPHPEAGSPRTYMERNLMTRNASYGVRRNRLDSQFDAMIRGAFGGQLAAVWSPAARFVQSGDDVFVDLEVPGVNAADIEVDVLDDTLVVSGRRDMTDVADDEHVLMNEMRSGSFRREFKLGSRIDADAVEASYNDGVLRVKLSALVAAHRPARVPVRTAHTSTEGTTDLVESTAETNSAQ